jgi:hypothetical protein
MLFITSTILKLDFVTNTIYFIQVGVFNQFFLIWIYHKSNHTNIFIVFLLLTYVLDVL